MLLPEPLGPSRASISPGSIVRLTSLTARTSSPAPRKCLTTPSSASIDAPVAARASDLRTRSRARGASGRAAQRNDLSQLAGGVRRAVRHRSASARGRRQSPVLSPVVLSTAVPSLASERRSSRIESRASRSTPSVGSSSSSRRGCRVSARARATRTFSPQSNSPGVRPARDSAPVRSSIARATAGGLGRGHASSDLRHGQVIEDRPSLARAKALDAIADLATEQIAPALAQVGSLKAHHAAVGRFQPGGDAQEGCPSRATHTPHRDQLARLDLEGDVHQRRGAARAAAVGLAHIPQLEQAHRDASLPAASALNSRLAYSTQGSLASIVRRLSSETRREASPVTVSEGVSEARIGEPPASCRQACP